MNSGKRQYHHGDLRTILLEVAARIIAAEGVDKVTMRALSQQAGVSRAAPYRHFTDKTALLCAVAAAGFKKLEKQLEITAEKHLGDDAALGLEGMAEAYVEFAVNNPAYYRLMFGREDLMKSPTPELRTSAKAAFVVLQEVIQKWRQDNSSISADTVSLTNVLWSAVHGLSMLLIDQQIQHGDTVTGIHPLLADEDAFSANVIRKLVNLTIRTIINGMKDQ